MGYTHYWTVRRLIAPDTFDAIRRDIMTAAILSGVRLADGWGNGAPEWGSDRLAFNGRRDRGEDHEEFSMSYDPCTEFCKTERKPYDVMVTAALIIAKHHLGDDIDVESDGGDEDWKAGRVLVQIALGYGDEGHLTEYGYRLAV